jgi:acyl-CoA reductase-like NAD-dependent aldehyde dehydrogenase
MPGSAAAVSSGSTSRARSVDAFVEKAAAWVSSGLKLGNPLDRKRRSGRWPMCASRGSAGTDRGGASRGARGLIDPKLFPADDGGAYLMPQILVDVTHDMRVMRDESFGPVVGIMPVKERRGGFRADERLPVRPDRLAVDHDDAERAARIGAEIETGTVFMNRADYLDPALCWTGCKATGRGGSLSEIGFHNLTRPKSYHLRKNPK